MRYSISLSTTGTHTFSGVTVGYGAQTPLTVTVTNTGNQLTGELNVYLSGTDSSSYTLSKNDLSNIMVGGTDTLSKNDLSNIMVGGTDTFTVVPKTGLAAGTYTAKVTVSDPYRITASFDVSFTVTAVAVPDANWGTDDTYAVGSGTLSQAVDYANGLGSGTAYIQLQRDVTCASTIEFNADKTTVLDLNDCTVASDHVYSVLAVTGNLTMKDISLEKAVTKTENNTPNTTTTTISNAEKSITITVEIPANMRGGSDYKIIRVHNGVAEILAPVYNALKQTLRFETDKFSTYAIAYTPEEPVTPPDPTEPPTPPPYSGGGDSGSTNSAPAPIVPKPEGGTVSITPKNPSVGDKVTITPKPDEGKELGDITVKDNNGKDVPITQKDDGTYTFVQPKGRVTIAVTFKPIAVKLPWNPFSDVTTADWFYDSVKYVYERGLMNGTSETAFSPNMTTNRGMIVTILWRLEGEPTAEGANPFTDVSADAYYAEAVAWAAENGIVKGYGNSSFGPNDPITREQLASILYRYAQFKGMDTTAKGDLSKFANQPSSWAAESVRWAVGAEIISGRGNGGLAPGGKATRAETAVMLARFMSE